MTLFEKPVSANQHPGQCRNCGVWLGPGSGVLMRKQRKLVLFCPSHPYFPEEQADFEKDRRHQEQELSS